MNFQAESVFFKYKEAEEEAIAAEKRPLKKAMVDDYNNKGRQPQKSRPAIRFGLSKLSEYRIGGA